MTPTASTSNSSNFNSLEIISSQSQLKGRVVTQIRGINGKEGLATDLTVAFGGALGWVKKTAKAAIEVTQVTVQEAPGALVHAIEFLKNQAESTKEAIQEILEEPLVPKEEIEGFVEVDLEPFVKKKPD